MRRWICILVLNLVLPVVLSACSKHNPDKSVTVIIVYNPFTGQKGSGTGFVVAKGGYIVTNHHVIEAALKSRNFQVQVRTEGENSRTYRAKIVWSSKGVDLAILHAPQLTAPPLDINTATLEKADSVIAIGFPGVADAIDPRGDVSTISTHTKGEVSRVVNSDWEGDGTYVSIIQHTAIINPGNSGGPLLNACGQVVGVNTSYATKGQGTFFSSHASEIAGVLKTKKIYANIISNRCNNEKSGFPYILVIASTIMISVVVSAIAMFVLSPRARQFATEKSTFLRSQNIRAKERTNRLQDTMSIFNETQQSKTGYFLKSITGMRNYELTPDKIKSNPVIIGRAVSPGDIEIVDDNISRQHARISCTVSEPYKFFIEDLNSKNGTKINGQTLDPSSGPVQIHPNDKVQFADIGYVFIYIDPPKETDLQETMGWILKGKDKTTGAQISFKVTKTILQSHNNELLIGRNKQLCNVALTDQTISSNGHAKIIFTENEFKIFDIGSSNGTIVNGQKLGIGKEYAVSISEGMTIRLGAFELHVERI